MKSLGLICVAAIGSLLGCASYLSSEETAGPEEYLRAVVQDFGDGRLSSAEDILYKARERFPMHEGIVFWSIELKIMRWQWQRALDDLVDFARQGEIHSLNRPELNGKIGELYFQLGRYGESYHYLKASSSGESKTPRRTLADLTRALPYVRRRVDVPGVELPMIEGSLPEMVCSFGDKKRSLVLDTGTSRTTLTKSLAKDLNVHDIVDFGLGRDGLGRTFAVWIGVLPSFSLGDVDLGSQPVLVVEDELLALRDPFGGAERSPAGVVGLDVLSRFKFSFYPHRGSVVFNMLGDLKDAEAVPCLFVQDSMLVPVRVEGTDLWFILDTGASHSSLTELGLQALPGGKKRAEVGYRQFHSPGGKAVLVQEVNNLKLHISAVEFVDQSLPVVQRLNPGAFPVHGVIGADLIMQCRTTLDRGRLLMRRR